jgi:Putative MetA-pathway of phenol degradation
VVMPAWRLTCAGAGLCLVLAWPAWAQDLDPRAYVHVPVNGTFLIVGLGISDGAVVSDPTLPVTDIQATVLTPSLGVGRSFNLFGRTAQAFAALPFSSADASGRVFGDAATTQRAGLSDMRIRVSWLVRGAPAASVVEIAKAPPRTILGLSLNVAAPTGEYFPDKLINLGTNRWAFRPEFAVSRPIGQRWLLDAYAGVWLFTTNHESYPGTLRKTQTPLGSFQAHLSHNFTRKLWAAFDVTYYVGGRTTVEGASPTDLQSNLRTGGTLAVPVGQRHSIKIAASRGAIVRLGTDFSSFSVAWQTAWAPRPTTAGKTTSENRP